MTVSSMTGFARAEGHRDGYGWTWEVKSVNGRGLDLRCRLPQGLDHLETAVRGLAPAHLSRGSVTAALLVTRPSGRVRLQLNREVLDQLTGIVGDLRREVEAAPPGIDGLLAFRGVVDVVEEEESPEARDAREAAMIASLGEAFAALGAARRAEGARLAAILGEHLEAIGALAAEARACAAAQPEALRERLRSAVAALLDAGTGLPEERLAQEAAVLVLKADVREELDRLDAHAAAAREMLAEGGAVGRRLDFLCQEFNREANTLCSKSADVALTRVGLALKARIEQMREQVQNVE